MANNGSPTNKELKAHNLTPAQFEILLKASRNVDERFRVRLYGVSAVTKNALNSHDYLRIDYKHDETKREQLANDRDKAIANATHELCKNKDWREAFNELKFASQLDSQRDERMTVISDYGMEVVRKLTEPRAKT